MVLGRTTDNMRSTLSAVESCIYRSGLVSHFCVGSSIVACVQCVPIHALERTHTAGADLVRRSGTQLDYACLSIERAAWSHSACTPIPNTEKRSSLVSPC